MRKANSSWPPGHVPGCWGRWGYNVDQWIFSHTLVAGGRSRFLVQGKWAQMTWAVDDDANLQIQSVLRNTCKHQGIGWRENLNQKPWFLHSNIGVSSTFSYHPISMKAAPREKIDIPLYESLVSSIWPAGEDLCPFPWNSLMVEIKPIMRMSSTRYPAIYIQTTVVLQLCLAIPASQFCQLEFSHLQLLVFRQLSWVFSGFPIHHSLHDGKIETGHPVIWRFPEIGVPCSSSIFGEFSLTKTNQLLGILHLWKVHESPIW